MSASKTTMRRLPVSATNTSFAAASYGDRRRTVQRRLAVGAVHLARRADLQEELAVARELEDVRVGRAGRRGVPRLRAAPAAAGGFADDGIAASARRRRQAPARARRRNPDVALRVHREAARRLRPGVALPGSAPARDEHALLIELEHERRRRAAEAGRWRSEHHPLLVGLERVAAAMDDPDVILRVDGDAGDRAEHPGLIREGPRPPGIDLIARSAVCPCVAASY